MSAQDVARALCCSAFLALATPLGAFAGPADDAYIAARAQHLSALAAAEKAGKSEDVLQKQDTAAIQDLEKRMTALLGPVRFKGLGATPTFSPGTLLEGDLETGLPDGLRFFADGDTTRAFVSPEPVFQNWLAIAAKEQGAPAAFREGLRAAMNTEDFYRLTVGSDAAFFKYAELPASGTEGETVQAFLGLFGQDDPTTNPPDTVVVARLANGRVYAGAMGIKTGSKAIPAACTQVWKSHFAKAEKLRAAVPKGKTLEDPRWEQAMQMDAEGAAAFRDCFAREFSALPAFAAATRRAETLLQILRGN